MDTVRSKDGTVIAFDRSGEGPPLILVDGALCSRALGPMPKLATHLAGRFTVFHYDRRGRGDSGDTAPYAVQREVEDLAAVIDAAGGSASVHGMSSGGALALEAARAGVASIAPTLRYDDALMSDLVEGDAWPLQRWAEVTVPTLVMDGGASPAWARNAVLALVDVLPDARHQTLADQTHQVAPEVLAPVLAEYFAWCRDSQIRAQ